MTKNQKINSLKFLKVLTILVSILSLIISILAWKVASKALDFQQNIAVSTGTVTICGKYDPTSDNLSLLSTEEDKLISSAVLILPTQLNYKEIVIYAPEMTLEFEKLRSLIIKLYPSSIDDSEEYQINIPVGIITNSSYQGGNYQKARLYSLILNKSKGKPIDFLTLLPQKDIDLDSFILFHKPWKKLDVVEKEKRIINHRIKEIRKIVDSYWDGQ